MNITLDPAVDAAKRLIARKEWALCEEIRWPRT